MLTKYKTDIIISISYRKLSRHDIYSEWLLFSAHSAMFQLYHGEIIMGSDLYKINTPSEFSMMLADWNNSPRTHMSPKSVTLSWFRTNQSLLFQLKAVYLAGSNEYQFHSLWFDPTGARTHDLPHSRWVR